jgi:hypothetical protein
MAFLTRSCERGNIFNTRTHPDLSKRQPFTDTPQKIGKQTKHLFNVSIRVRTMTDRQFQNLALCKERMNRLEHAPEFMNGLMKFIDGFMTLLKHHLDFPDTFRENL